MVDGKETPRIQSLMHWVRILLPIALASLGWFVGQTVGNFDKRLTEVERQQSLRELTFAAHVASNDEKIVSLQRRLDADELTMKDLVSISEYMSSINSLDKRVDKIEDRLNK